MGRKNFPPFVVTRRALFLPARRANVTITARSVRTSPSRAVGRYGPYTEPSRVFTRLLTRTPTTANFTMLLPLGQFVSRYEKSRSSSVRFVSIAFGRPDCRITCPVRVGDNKTVSTNGVWFTPVTVRFRGHVREWRANIFLRSSPSRFRPAFLFQ